MEDHPRSYERRLRARLCAVRDSRFCTLRWAVGPARVSAECLSSARCLHLVGIISAKSSALGGWLPDRRQLLPSRCFSRRFATARSPFQSRVCLHFLRRLHAPLRCWSRPRPVSDEHCLLSADGRAFLASETLESSTRRSRGIARIADALCVAVAMAFPSCCFRSILQRRASIPNCLEHGSTVSY